MRHDRRLRARRGRPRPARRGHAHEHRAEGSQRPASSRRCAATASWSRRPARRRSRSSTPTRCSQRTRSCSTSSTCCSPPTTKPSCSRAEQAVESAEQRAPRDRPGRRGRSPTSGHVASRVGTCPADERHPRGRRRIVAAGHAGGGALRRHDLPGRWPPNSAPTSSRSATRAPRSSPARRTPGRTTRSRSIARCARAPRSTGRRTFDRERPEQIWTIGRIISASLGRRPPASSVGRGGREASTGRLRTRVRRLRTRIRTSAAASVRSLRAAGAVRPPNTGPPASSGPQPVHLSCEALRHAVRQRHGGCAREGVSGRERSRLRPARPTSSRPPQPAGGPPRRTARRAASRTTSAGSSAAAACRRPDG